MSEGTQSVEKLAELLGEGVNVAYSLLHSGGLLSALAITDELMALSSIPKGSIVAQFKDLDPEERKRVDKVFQDKVSLADKELEKKIEEGELALEEAVDVVLSGLAVYSHGKSVAEKLKALLVPKP